MQHAAGRHLEGSVACRSIECVRMLDACRVHAMLIRNDSPLDIVADRLSVAVCEAMTNGYSPAKHRDWSQLVVSP
jgi:hypothetical protein